MPSGPDLTLWRYWWEFNREPYLNLKSHVHSGLPRGDIGCRFGPESPLDEIDSFRPSDQLVRARVVPALLRALDTEQSTDIVTGSLVALAKIGDSAGEDRSPMTEVILRSLASANPEIQETAALALGILGNERNIPLLAALIHDDWSSLWSLGIRLRSRLPERTRAFAAYALGLIGSHASERGRQAIVAALVRELDATPCTKDTRDLPVACMTSLGLTALPFDAAALAAVDLLGSMPKPAQVTDRLEQVVWLLNCFDDRAHPALDRAQVPAAITRLLGDVPAELPLRSQVAARFAAETRRTPKSDGEAAVQQSCILALGQLSDCDEDAVDVSIRSGLEAIAQHGPYEQSRYFALIALGQLAGRPGLGRGPLSGLRGSEGVRALLLERLQSGHSEERSWAGLSLGILERTLGDHEDGASPDTLRVMRATLASAKCPSEIGAMAIALGLARDAEAKDLLRDRLKNISEPEARGFLAVGLGMLDDRQSIELITGVARRSKFQPDLIKSAATGLALLGDKEIVSELITMLGTASGLSSQAAISCALGTIGDVRAIEPLIALLEDKEKTEKARGFAAVALGIVADKERLPWNSKISVDANYRATTETLTSPEMALGVLDIL